MISTRSTAYDSDTLSADHFKYIYKIAVSNASVSDAMGLVYNIVSLGGTIYTSYSVMGQGSGTLVSGTVGLTIVSDTVNAL